MRLADQFHSLEGELNQLDRAVGDGDHGSTLKRGFQAAAKSLAGIEEDESPKTVLITAGSEFVNVAGGASGLLFSVLFKELGRACGETTCLQALEFTQGLKACVDRISQLGKVNVGDKTMLDALQPASVAASKKQSEGLKAAVAAATVAAETGALATIPMAAKRGRARYVPEGGKGHIDPGARSIACIFKILQQEIEPKP